MAVLSALQMPGMADRTLKFSPHLEKLDGSTKRRQSLKQDFSVNKRDNISLSFGFSPASFSHIEIMFLNLLCFSLTSINIRTTV